ncbi:MAG TPA: PAS domain-containing protein [Urbifossiella sp.]|jgi:PAS domain S-box-containing protein|nr:PAS domain-containing protein [Urbifossiella sp.]
MDRVFRWLADTSGFVARRECGDWTDPEVALHVVSDLLIWLAYLSIPLVLVYFARRRRGLPFSRLFILFAAFILACGTTHLVEAVIFYNPVYHLSGVVKAVTAAVSWMTVLALVPAVPRLLDLTAAAARAGEAVPTAPDPAPRWRGYAVALAATAACLLVRLLLDPLLDGRYPYLVAFLAVIYVAWEAGFGPAVLCTVLTGLGTELWFVHPYGQLFGGDLADRVAFGLFLFSGVGTGVLGEAQRQARERAELALAAAGDRQAELDRQRALLDTLFETSPAGLALLGADGRYVRVNAALAAVSGLAPAGHVGKAVAETLPGVAAGVGPVVRQVLANGQPALNLEVRGVPAADPGREHVYLASYYPVPGAAGDRPGVGVVVTDITDREEARTLARETADRLALSLDAARLGDWNWDAATNAVDLSPRAAGVFGLDPDAPVTWADVENRAHPADRDRVAAAVAAAVAARSEYDIEYRVLRPGGGEAWVSARGRATYAPDGAPRGMYGVAADVTARKRAEADLRRSEERYRAFVAQSTEGIWRIEMDEPLPVALPEADQLAAVYRDARLAECNDAFARMYGYTYAVELTGAGVADFLDPADPRTTAFLTAFVRGGYRLTEAESRERDRYGAERVFLNTLVGVVEDGRVVRAWGTQRDVTDRTRAEEQLRASEERYRLATEAVRGLVYDADHAADRVERSGGMFDLIGVRPADSDPTAGWWDLRVHPDDLPRARAESERAVARGAATFQTEYRVRHADGRWVWVEDRSRVMYGGDGRPRRVVGCRTDVSARKEADARLRESEARFRTLAEAVPVAVWVCRPDGWTEYMNARWEEATGAPPAESLGAGWLAQVHPDDRARAAAAWTAAVADPAVGYRIEYRLRDRGGGYHWYLAAGDPYRDETGAVSRWFGTCTDIDDRKRQAETLERLVAERTTELVRSNKELEEFAYAASHDLQEPLRKIQTYGTRLRDKARDRLDDDNRDRLDRMMASAGRMAKLIDDLLAYSRVTTRAKAFAPVDLTAALADALDDLAARVEQAGGAVTAGPLPTVPADPGQMRQLFQNLVGNALKFHRPGVPPAVSVTAAQTEAGWAITVADNGIGFEDRHATRIFQVFQRLHGREEYEGTGVGLAVCKKIVDRHGGTITAHGRPGEGATFVVTLPDRAAGEFGRGE